MLHLSELQQMHSYFVANKFSYTLMKYFSPVFLGLRDIYFTFFFCFCNIFLWPFLSLWLNICFLFGYFGETFPTHLLYSLIFSNYFSHISNTVVKYFSHNFLCFCKLYHPFRSLTEVFLILSATLAKYCSCIYFCSHIYWFFYVIFVLLHYYFSEILHLSFITLSKYISHIFDSAVQYFPLVFCNFAKTFLVYFLLLCQNISHIFSDTLDKRWQGSVDPWAGTWPCKKPQVRNCSSVNACLCCSRQLSVCLMGRNWSRGCFSLVLCTPRRVMLCLSGCPAWLCLVSNHECMSTCRKCCSVLEDLIFLFWLGRNVFNIVDQHVAQRLWTQLSMAHCLD